MSTKRKKTDEKNKENGTIVNMTLTERLSLPNQILSAITKPITRSALHNLTNIQNEDMGLTPNFKNQKMSSPIDGVENICSKQEATPIRDYTRRSRISPKFDSNSKVYEDTKVASNLHEKYIGPESKAENMGKKRQPAVNKEEIDRWCREKNSELEEIDSQDLYIE